jgi:hypothetical protein
MRNNPKNCSFSDMEWLLINKAGCEIVSRTGSHNSIKHPRYHGDAWQDGITIPYRHPIRSVYVKQALAYYDDIMEYIQEENNNEDE